jgi:hypothetical protein
MSNNKIDFINDLLSSKKIKIEEKSKVLELTKVELMNFGVENTEIKKRIDNIENRIKEIEGEITNDISDKINSEYFQNEEKKLLPDYQDPKDLKKFLLEFNQNPILKYTCHEIDDMEFFLENFENKVFSLDNYLMLINREYKKISSKYYGKINKNIQGLIWAYLKGGNPWSSDKIKISWGSEQLKQWCINHQDMVPNPGINLRRLMRYDGFEFDSFFSKNTNKRIASFSDLVIHFKHMFHIRNDNSLKQIIERKNLIEKYIEYIDFEINLPENIEFFSDVDKITQAYQRIIEMILDFVNSNKKEKPIIKLSLFEVKNEIIFSIHHKNSVFGKRISNCINRVGEKENNLINNQINGICKMHLKADFGEGNFAEINLWNGQPRMSNKLNEFEGVEFQLIF